MSKLGAPIRGWCPTAHHPMATGDGLLVRVRPWLGRISLAQTLELIRLAERYGNGRLDLTNRANWQVRGVSSEGHPSLLAGLIEAGLVAPDPELEARRNVIAQPFWRPGDLTEQVANALLVRLHECPPLPPKFGFVVDCGPTPALASVPANIRIEAAPGAVSSRAGVEPGIERHPFARLVVRTAGSPASLPAATPWEAVAHTLSLLPASLRVGATPGIEGRRRPVPDLTPLGPLAALPFGRIEAAALTQAIRALNPTALRLTPWRALVFEGSTTLSTNLPGLIASPYDPRLRAHACPGAPACPQAATDADTRALATALATRTADTVHVSGCPKGCAHSAPAAITLVGRADAFDLVHHGHASDPPAFVGLRPTQVLAEVSTLL